ncbi:MAG: hypothetical protein K2F94_04395 [Muribaculaceae bacterium]|nr:hypothetical protein [Muribaculaceae bacterium]MDE6534070.1 hypothetical protein [Muribaculaceae bacterium]
MEKPVFNHCDTLFTLSWILTLPILIDICTACTLFSFWVVWVFFVAVLVISIIRIGHGIKQKCYKFCLLLTVQLIVGAAVLLFFQLSFNRVIQTPVSNPLSPDILNIENPIHPDSSRIEGDSCPIVDGKERSFEKEDDKTDMKGRVISHIVTKEK